jgi:hypothetical protein
VDFGSAIALSGGSATSVAVSTLALGAATVTAVYGGDANFNGTTGILSGGQTVNPADTATVVSSSTNPSVFGQSITFTATVGAAAPGAGTLTGTVQFRTNGVDFGSAVALSGGNATSLAVSTLAAGSTTVTAVYSGDANFNGSTFPNFTQMVNTAGTATQVRVETLANGSGMMVSAQNVASGSSVTGFAISRDQFNNFVANVAATWSLANVTGGVVSGDLVTAADAKSANFTGLVIGTANVHAVVSGLTPTDSGTLTVAAGTATQARVETAADGSGNVVAAQNVTAGNSVTVYSIARDASGNFIANVAATWSLASVTGGVVGGDLVAAVDTKSATFTGHAVGSAKMHALVAGWERGLRNTNSANGAAIQCEWRR